MNSAGNATYDTVQEMQDIYHSTGVSVWAGFTDNLDGTVDVAGGSGYLRPTDNVLDTLLAIDWPSNN